MDAARWARSRGYEVVWIASPHASGAKFEEHAVAFLRGMAGAGALPTAVIFENYKADAPAGYPNVVGSEDRPATTLGVARALQRRVAEAK